ncbi:MAG: carboxypeptidase-like regulatory domain-containing protein [Flavobacteriales bacterium]|nr:carboxypeptidase-like regulatory domain-containing protein [Flavobacteriales bacterium]
MRSFVFSQLIDDVRNAFLLLAITPNLCFVQLQRTVISNKTKEPIHFVNIWVKGEDFGTTTNENGQFSIDIESTVTLVCPAVGFETKRIA